LNRKVDLRTAAYVNAIMRLDEFYAVTGVNWSCVDLDVIQVKYFWVFLYE
jgi:hypothetical protein